MAKQQVPPVAQFSLSGGEQTNPSATKKGVPPVAQFSLPGTDNSNQQSQTLGSKALDVAKGVGNFFFPIVGDVGADIQGKSDKSALQQTGDLALSVLPFIPGLGEVGEATRAGKAAVEGGEVAAESGLLSKAANFIKGSPVAKGALTGYGAGVASNLSQGKGVGESLMPNTNTVLGTALGGATPKIIDGLSSFVRSISGITPEIKNALLNKGEGDSKLLQKYINVVKNRSADITAPSAQNVATDELENAAKIIQKKADTAGATVGAEKLAGAKVPFGNVTPVIQNFQKEVANRYGLNLSIGENGVEATPLSGRSSILNPSDVTRLTNAFAKLTDLQNGSVQKATDVISALRQDVNFNEYSKTLAKSADPLTGLMSHTAGELDNVLRKSSPSLATANDQFSHLSNLLSEVRNMAGGDLQRGELMMRRIFSGDKGADVSKLFQDIQNETGSNLVKHAVFAKAVTDALGGANDKTLFEKGIEGAINAQSGGLGSTLLGAGKRFLQSTIVNPESALKRTVKGSSGLLKSLATKGAIKAGTSASGLINQ